jgi:hypothetical protein
MAEVNIASVCKSTGVRVPHAGHNRAEAGTGVLQEVHTIAKRIY